MQHAANGDMPKHGTSLQLEYVDGLATGVDTSQAVLAV